MKRKMSKKHENDETPYDLEYEEEDADDIDEDEDLRYVFEDKNTQDDWKKKNYILTVRPECPVGMYRTVKHQKIYA